MKIRNLLIKLNKITFKTIYFNLRYLPFNQAVKLPVFISNNVYLLKTLGQIEIQGPIKPGVIEIGFGNVTIFDKTRSRTVWDVSGKVVFKTTARIGHGSKISVNPFATLILGDNFEITAETSIIAYKHIEFGRECLLSWDILIMDSDAHKIKDKAGNVINPAKPIVVGDKVWIGARCTILKGTIIPDGAIIAAGSLVSRVLTQANTIFGGSPARELKSEVTWEI